MQIKRVLILGSGGREHVLAKTYAKNKNVEKIFVAPGNGLVDFKNKKICSLQMVNVNDLDAVLNVCKKYDIDLVDVAQDESLANGFVERLRAKKIQTFGPTKNAAEIEWNKEWARNFMKKYKLPTPLFKSFSDTKTAIKYVNKLSEQALFIKASGLALGKGAIYAKDKQETIRAINTMGKFGKSGKTFLIEKCMIGEELSLFALCDGKNYVIVGAAQDHKNIYNNDRGPNTGGMGCVSPCNIITAKIMKEVRENILNPFMKGMVKENRPYEGMLYLGGMLTKTGVKIVEFNARWGDPEAEVILPSIKTDYLKIVKAVRMKNINKLKINLDNKVRISVAGCSRGYPDNYSLVKGKEIFGLQKAIMLPNITIFGAGIIRKGKRFFVNGGRIFHLVASGKDVIEARRFAYQAMSTIYIKDNNLHYRTDIGHRDMQRFYKK